MPRRQRGSVHRRQTTLVCATLVAEGLSWFLGSSPRKLLPLRTTQNQACRKIKSAVVKKLQTLRTSVGLHVKEEVLLPTRSLICSRTLEDRRSGETRSPAPLTPTRYLTLIPNDLMDSSDKQPRTLYFYSRCQAEVRPRPGADDKSVQLSKSLLIRSRVSPANRKLPWITT
jgi:hypothetical protein